MNTVVSKSWIVPMMRAGWVLLALSLFVPISGAEEGEEGVAPAQQRLIVAVADAALMAGEERIGEVALGTIVIASREQTGWMYVPALEGWLSTRDLVPLEGAVEEFTRRIEAQPVAEHYQLRGIARMAREDWPRAAQDLEKSYELGNSSVSLHLALGSCYDHMNQLVPALEEFDSILKTFPDEGEAYLARGRILLRQEQHRAALRDFEKAVELQPQSAEAHNLQGVALRNLEKWKAAAAAYDRALELHADYADALANRAYVHKQLGDAQAARDDYERALKLDPESAAIQNDLAWLLATAAQPGLRDGERAAALAEAACDKTGNSNGEYLDTLAAAYARAGRFEAAVEAAKLALSLVEEEGDRDPIRARLKIYREHKAFEEPARKPSEATD